MWRDLLLGLLATVLTGVGTWALKTLIPYLNSLVDERTKNAVMETIWTAVCAAEQIYPNAGGLMKFNYVLELVNGMYDMDEEHLRALIEQAVFNLKLETQGG